MSKHNTRYKDRNVARAVWAGIAAHVRCSSYGDTFHRERESRERMKAKITQTLACIAPRLHRYLQSVLSTFIKLQHNPCPESTDWKQYFLHFNYRRSWLDGAVWPQYHSLTNRWKQSLKFAQTYWHILLFSNSTERAADTIIISGWRAPDWPRHSEQLTILWRYYINDTEKWHGKTNKPCLPPPCHIHLTLKFWEMTKRRFDHHEFNSSAVVAASSIVPPSNGSLLSVSVFL